MSDKSIEVMFADMSRGEKRRIFKSAKKNPRKFPEVKDMSFTEFNKLLPKFKNE